MARKRLYGETQKRRKKKQTQALKRQGSVTRVQSTHQPAPFQRAGEVSSQDVAFMEAMRDMGVNRYPRVGEAPVRQEKFEAVQFAASKEDQDGFLAAMENLGVRPIAADGSAEHESATDQSLERDSAAESSGGDQSHSEPEARQSETGQSETEQPGVGQSKAKQSKAGQSKTEQSNTGQSGIEPGQPPSPPARRQRAEKPQRARAATIFDLGEDGAELMAEALRDGDFDPKAKFEGAPKPPPGIPPPQQMEDTEREPDAELDLHGKTQEEAIHMVQNFLLTSYHRKLRHVLIITGKGHNSGPAGPVLREAVYHWLERNGDRFARSFAWAPPRHGGEGAIWVVLR